MIPIKFLPEEIEEGLASAMYTRLMDWTGKFEWDFTRSATNQRGVLEVYLEEKGYSVVQSKADNHVTLFDKNDQTPSYIRLKIKKNE